MEHFGKNLNPSLLPLEKGDNPLPLAKGGREGFGKGIL
jgi:hypothetical protein